MLSLALVLGLGAPVPAAAQGLLQGDAGVAPEILRSSQYWLTIERGDEGLLLTGQVPDQLTRRVIGTYAAALFGTDAVTSALGHLENGDENVPPPEWVQSAMAAIEVLSSVAAGSAELTEGAVLLSGTVQEPEDAGVLTRTIGAKLPPGIRLSTAFDVPAPDIVAGRDLAPERCGYLMNRVAQDQRILFSSGSDQIAEESMEGLGVIAGLFKRCPDVEIEIAGFTDSSGDPDRNLALSQARAEAVMQSLRQAGTPIRQLRARGFGDAEPIADNETEAGRAQNRRIEFRLVE